MIHRTFIANGQYPRFTGSPAFAPRAPNIAKVILAHDCDSAVFNEMGYRECVMLSNQPAVNHWEYDRAQGAGRGVPGEGLNSVWTNPQVWARSNLSDYNLPSFGQWQRTALGVRLTEIDAGGFAKLFAVHFAAKGAPLSAASADRAKLAQVKYLRKKNADSRVAWMGDFPRTGRSDDLAWLTKEDYKTGYAASRTPLAVLVHGAVTVHSVTAFSHGSMFDHDYLVAEWSVAGKEVA